MDEQRQELVMVQPQMQPPVKKPATAAFPFGWVALGLGILVVLGGVLFFILHNHILSSGTSRTASSQATPTPQVKIVDFSPDVPLTQKTSLLIEKNDSSLEKVLIQKDLVAGYIKNLPPGYRVVSQNPAQ